MTLDLQQMREIARGCAWVGEEDGYFCLRRFTERQANAYKAAGEEGLYRRTFATAGVRVAFRTDSQTLSFSYRRVAATSRTTAYFDVYVDRLMTDHFGFPTMQPECGEIGLRFGAGEHTVEICFPWECAVLLKNVTLEDGAFLKGVHRPRRLLAFGDSITQGVYSRHPSLSYICRLADLLDADLTNKGIGGDMVFPELLCEAEPNAAPDLITVAYGTNDWGCRTKEVFLQKYQSFMQRLCNLYEGVPIIAITPVWRYDWQKKGTPMGISANEVGDLIRSACKGLSGVRVIDGWSLIPAHNAFFYDGVHPNDLGFGVYAENLYAKIVNDVL